VIELMIHGRIAATLPLRPRTVLAMILLTRLGGRALALNPDLVERAESTPDTVLTLVDGTHFVVTESLAEIVRLMREHRAAVIVTAQYMEETGVLDADAAVAQAPPLRVVQGGNTDQATTTDHLEDGLRRLEHELGEG
jgi:flagellar protein FlbD